MNVTCPKCQTVYRVDPAKVPGRGVRARCAECAGVFFVSREAGAPAAALAVSGAGTMPPVPAAPAQAPPPVAAPAQVAAPARPAFAPPVGGIAPAAAPLTPAPPPRPAVAPARGAPSWPAERPPVVPTAPAAIEAPAAVAPRAVTPAVPEPVRSAPAPAEAPAAPKRPVNPFLAQDPSTKARRLARALISDLVVYHPAKRADGLRDGTLKLLFEEEIKKCWEEYTDQVGLDMATSTPYFTEALNEILAGGQPVFS